MISGLLLQSETLMDQQLKGVAKLDPLAQPDPTHINLQKSDLRYMYVGHGSGKPDPYSNGSNQD